MADTFLNITVKAETGELVDLVKKLNTGNITVAEYNKTIRQLRNDSIVGSQTQKQLKEVISQVSDQTLTSNGQMMKSYFQTGEAIRQVNAQRMGLTDLIKKERQEDRMLNFAVRESLNGLQGLTGENKELAKAVTGSVEAFSGMSFGLSALGGIFAQVAIPLALAVGLWTLIKGLWGDAAENSKKLTEELKKQDEAIEGIIENMVKLGKITKDEQINNYKAQIEALKSANKTTETKTGINMINGIPLAYQYDVFKLSSQERLDNLKKISDLEVKIQEVQKEQTDEAEKKHKAELKALKDADDFIITHPKTDAWVTGLTISGLQGEVQEKLSGAFAGRAGAGKEIPGLGAVAPRELPQMRTDLSAMQRIYGSLGVATHRWNAELNTTNQLIEGFDQGIGGLANKWTNTITGLMQGTQNIGQAFRSMAQAVVQELETIIAKMIAMWTIEQLLGLVFSGGTSAIGSFSGGGIPGEARLFSKISSGPAGTSIPSQMNQMSLSTKAGGNNFKVPSPQIIPIVDAGRLSVMVKYGGQIRNNGARF